MVKIDLKKELKALYNQPSKDITLVEVPELKFIMIDGQGSPESQQYSQSIQALYPIAYTIKFARKKADGTDYGVMPLEGLWWADDMTAFTSGKAGREKWQWTLIIMQPDFITQVDFRNAREAAAKKKDNPFIAKVRLESFKEGKSVQIMYIGPFSGERPVIQRMHQKIQEIGGKLYGKHHEIYLSDIRKADPSKWKTVLRQPYSI
jgi:hypothetical protein